VNTVERKRLRRGGIAWSSWDYGEASGKRGAGKMGMGGENNLPGAGVAGVILAEQSASNATQVVARRSRFCPVKIVNCPP